MYDPPDMRFFQSGWKWCHRCQGLFYSRSATQGHCRGDRQPHDGIHSGAYALFFLPPTGELPASTARSEPLFGQPGWKWCRKCEALFYGGNPSHGVCPADSREHDGSRSGQYIIDYLGRQADRGGEPYQNGWQWCARCQQLVFGNPVDGACAAAGRHVPSGFNYVLRIAGPLHDAPEARLLVIAPAHFQDALRILIAHKNATGRPTHLATRESLIDHFMGRDDPEKIKRGITFAYEYLRTQFVFLVGDASLIPVRYRRTTLAPGDRNWRDGWYTPADLYYANLYRNHAPVDFGVTASGGFNNWDSNGDNKFNEHHWAPDARSFNPDQVDGVPDVAVGRLPAHTTSEVMIYSDKVIAYETGRARSPRVDMTVFIDKRYEAAYALAQLLVQQSRISTARPAWGLDLAGLNYDDDIPPPGVRRAWARETPVAEAAARTFWLTYIGHGNHDGWGVEELRRPLNSARVEAFTNSRNLPIVYVAGCDTGQFVNCPPDHRYRDINEQAHWYWAEGDPEHLDRPTRVYDLGDRAMGSQPIREWLPRHGLTPMITAELPHPYDFANRKTRTFARAWLCAARGGGAIAYFGETTTCQNNWAVDLEVEMLRAYVRGVSVLGAIWMAGQQEYWKRNHNSENQIGAPRIYLTYMTLFGDPSLRLW